MIKIMSKYGKSTYNIFIDALPKNIDLYNVCLGHINTEDLYGRYVLFEVEEIDATYLLVDLKYRIVGKSTKIKKYDDQFTNKFLQKEFIKGNQNGDYRVKSWEYELLPNIF